MSSSSSLSSSPSTTGDLGYGLDRVQDGMNYYAWLAEVIAPELRGSIIEHGAGTGALSLALLAHGVKSLVLSEPDAHLSDLLTKKFANYSEARVFPGTIDDYLSQSGAESIGGIVSSNVLEHIEDDLACLETMWSLLSPGGTLALYVPARPELYGSLDRAVGHYRRYTKRDLQTKLEKARFRVRSIEYRNLVGALGWWLNARVLKRELISEGSVGFYDRLVFPVCRFVEDRVPLPYGQNLLVFAEKPSP